MVQVIAVVEDVGVAVLALLMVMVRKASDAQFLDSYALSFPSLLYPPSPPPTAGNYHYIAMWSQVLVLLSDTGRRGQAPLSVPKHPRRPKTPSRRLQEAPKTPKRPPRSLQDLQDDPKSTPKRPHLGTSGNTKKNNKNMWSLMVFRKSSLCLSSSVRC